MELESDEEFQIGLALSLSLHEDLKTKKNLISKSKNDEIPVENFGTEGNDLDNGAKEILKDMTTKCEKDEVNIVTDEQGLDSQNSSNKDKEKSSLNIEKRDNENLINLDVSCTAVDEVKNQITCERYDSSDNESECKTENSFNRNKKKKRKRLKCDVNFKKHLKEEFHKTESSNSDDSDNYNSSVEFNSSDDNHVKQANEHFKRSISQVKSKRTKSVHSNISNKRENTHEVKMELKNDQRISHNESYEIRNKRRKKKSETFTQKKVELLKEAKEYIWDKVSETMNCMNLYYKVCSEGTSEEIQYVKDNILGKCAENSIRILTAERLQNFLNKYNIKIFADAKSIIVPYTNLKNCRFMFYHHFEEVFKTIKLRVEKNGKIW